MTEPNCPPPGDAGDDWLDAIPVRLVSVPRPDPDAAYRLRAEFETLALAEIAFSLGYSEVSAFNHAFRRWVGQSPGHYRRLRATHSIVRSEEAEVAR